MTRVMKIAAAALALIAVGVATLTPTAVGRVDLDFWCLACGELGGLDVIANVVMFIPLGLAMALALGRWRRAVLVCAAVTLVVEVLQIRVVTGRDASLSDLLANTLGGALGASLAFGWPALVKPTARGAHRLALAWAAFVAALFAITSWSLVPAEVPSALWIQRTPLRPSYEPFTGKLLAFDVEGMEISDRFPDRPLELQRLLQQNTWTATVAVDTRGLRPTRSIIIRVAEELTVLVWMDQVGWNLTCLQKTRSAVLRLRSPKVALVNGLLPPNGDTESDDPNSIAQLSCSRRHATLAASASFGNGMRDYRLPLSPSLGWLLLSPFDLAFDRRFYSVSVLWLVALLVPAGYWSSAAGRSDHGGRLALGSHGLVAAVAALVGGLALVPRVFDVAVGAWWEWAASLVGFALGVVIQRLVARVRSRDHDNEHPLRRVA